MLLQEKQVSRYNFHLHIPQPHFLSFLFFWRERGGGGENSRSKDFKTNINAVLAELLKLSYK